MDAQELPKLSATARAGRQGSTRACFDGLTKRGMKEVSRPETISGHTGQSEGPPSRAPRPFWGRFSRPAKVETGPRTPAGYITVTVWSVHSSRLWFAPVHASSRTVSNSLS
jgi:hypothetical protein